MSGSVTFWDCSSFKVSTLPVIWGIYLELYLLKGKVFEIPEEIINVSVS